MEAVQARAFELVAASKPVYTKHQLVSAFVRYIEASIQAGRTTIIAFLTQSPADGDAATAFLSLVQSRGIDVQPLLRGHLPADSGPGSVYFVDSERPLDHRGAIEIAARLSCSVAFLTCSEMIHTAQSAYLGENEVLEHVNFHEMLEIGETMDNAIPPLAVQRAWATNTPLKIFALETWRWTAVTHDTYEKRTRVTACITSKSDLTFVEAHLSDDGGTIRWAIRDALGSIARQGIAVEQIQMLRTGMTFACETRSAFEVVRQLRRLHFITHTEPCVRLFAVGAELRSTPGVLIALLDSLESEGVGPLHINDGAVSISLIVGEAEATRAEIAMRRIFAAESQAHRSTWQNHIAFDAATRTLRVRERSERLGMRQAKILHLLMNHAGKTISPELLAQSVFESCDAASLAAIRVHIHNLRKKLEDDPVEPKFILTIPDKGYMFASQIGVQVERERNQAKA